MLIVFSSEVIELLHTLARERLTAKQKGIIRYLDRSHQDIPATRLVRDLIGPLACSEATVWNNLNQLKRIGILSSGDIRTKGQPVKITVLGKLISHGLGDGYG